MNAELADQLDPAGRATVRAWLAEINAAPNRTLGQNFLVNAGVLDRIVQTAAIEKTDSVLEIGPGLGALTIRLTQSARYVAAIEKDAALFALLGRKWPAGNLHLIQGDALRVDWSDLGLPERNIKVVANLPYSISKPMLRRLLEEWRPHLTSATVMVQREVATRLTAKCGERDYGPMALMAQLYCDARRAFDVSAGSFLPPPEVVSTVVHLQILPQPRVVLEDEAFFWRVVRAAFSQRRKQIGNTLRAIIADKDRLAGVLLHGEIQPSRRAETVSLEEFAMLANSLRRE